MATRRVRRLATGTILAAAVGALIAQPPAPNIQAEDAADDKLVAEARQNFQPLPDDAGTADHPLTKDRVELGRMLFFDPRISIDGVGSCVRCHQPALYGADALPKSRGIRDQVQGRNAPTVLNVALHFKVHWDGLFETVEDQARRALLGPGFGNPDHAAAMAKIKAIPGYAELFSKAFPDQSDSVTEENWGVAIGAYERTLVTPSRFDEFLAGKPKALSEAEQRGLRTFMQQGCNECHDGGALGGNDFKKFGIVNDYWKSTHSQPIDKGRFNLTKKADDMYVFKVPSLRNVAMTPPYFHDGSVGSLAEAVRIMATTQLGNELSDEETNDLVSFLNSLTGKLPTDFAQAPVLPPAGFVPPTAPSGTSSQ
ncbi:MAG TPA: cytochrome c peroxidase [Pirellulales bacterium]|nr:cytochrome c peroxidase [Pirellulales bacterium]